SVGSMTSDGTLNPVYISGEGNSTIYVYYTRDTYTVTINYLYSEASLNDGTITDAEIHERVRLGESVVVTYPTFDGYEIVGGETGTTITVVDDGTDANA